MGLEWLPLFALEAFLVSIIIVMVIFYHELGHVFALKFLGIKWHRTWDRGSPTLHFRTRPSIEKIVLAYGILSGHMVATFILYYYPILGAAMMVINLAGSAHDMRMILWPEN